MTRLDEVLFVEMNIKKYDEMHTNALKLIHSIVDPSFGG